LHDGDGREYGGRDFVYDGNGDGGWLYAGDDCVQRHGGDGSAGMQADAEECGECGGGDDGVYDGAFDDGVDDWGWWDGSGCVDYV